MFTLYSTHFIIRSMIEVISWYAYLEESDKNMRFRKSQQQQSQECCNATVGYGWAHCH